MSARFHGLFAGGASRRDAARSCLGVAVGLTMAVAGCGTAGGTAARQINAK
jgi:hypothetical protein